MRLVASACLIACAAALLFLAVLSVAMAVSGVRLGPTGSEGGVERDRLLLVAYAAALAAGGAATAFTASWVARTPFAWPARPSTDLLARVLAGVAALTALPAAAVAAFLAWWGLDMVDVRPDPSVPDGDPCCGHPDEYRDVVLAGIVGSAYALGALALLVSVFALGRLALLGGAGAGWAGGRGSRLAIGAAVLTAAATVAFAAVGAWSGGGYP